MMKPVATLTVESVKMLRETLALSQAALAAWEQLALSDVTRDIQRLGDLITQLDAHRPLGTDGKHDNRHTPTCGCEWELVEENPTEIGGEDE